MRLLPGASLFASCAFSLACSSAPPTEPVTPTSPTLPTAPSAAEPVTPAPLPTTAPPATTTPPSKAPPPSTPKPAAITSVQLSLENKCAQKVDYCVEDGSSLSTSLTSNTSTTHRVSPGAKIKLRKGNNCTETVYTVTDASAEQKAQVCK